jgi:hypothetical protein
VSVSKVCVRNAKREHEQGEELRIFRKEGLEDVHFAPYSTLGHSLQLRVLRLGLLQDVEQQGKCRCTALEECGKKMFEKQCAKDANTRN